MVSATRQAPRGSRGSQAAVPGRELSPLESPHVTEPAPPPALDHSALHRAFHRAVAEQLAADRVSPTWPAAEIDRIEACVARRTRRSAASNLAAHLRTLDEAADIDIAAPTDSTRPVGRGVKVAISRAVGWYVGHIAGQVRHLAVATARAMRATAVRVDELEGRIDVLEAAVEDAADRPAVERAPTGSTGVE